MRQALERLNAFDIVGFCRHVAPEAWEQIPQLHGTTSCDDVRLRTIMSSCSGCERDNRIEGLDVDVNGDTAVAHMRIREQLGSPRVVTKDVRLTRRAGTWLLLDSPAAVVP